jgi:hypothetical protein
LTLELTTGSIVFIHGLQGHPRDTWTWSPSKIQKSASLRAKEPKREKALKLTGRFFSTQKNKKLADAYVSDNTEETDDRKNILEVYWPEDLLKVDFPQARIFTFGYDTVITKGFRPVNQGTIFTHSRTLLVCLEQERKKDPNRNLIFIAHSLGGIIAKEVLRLSRTSFDEQVERISKCTTGVFFFGTPHRGSKDWASFANDFTVIARILGMDINNTILRDLVPGDMLEQSQSDFMALWTKNLNRLTVRTFQESKAVLGTSLGGLNKLVLLPFT